MSEPLREEQGETSKSGWGQSLKMMGAVGGLGIEMAAVVVLGAWAGQQADQALGTGSGLTVLGVVLGVVVFGAHVRYLLRRKADPQQEQER